MCTSAKIEKITTKEVLKIMFLNPKEALTSLLDIIERQYGDSIPLKHFRLDKAVEMFKDNPVLFYEWRDNMELYESVWDTKKDVRNHFVRQFLSLGLMQESKLIQKNNDLLRTLDCLKKIENYYTLDDIASTLMNSQHNPHSLKGKKFLLFQLSLTLRHLTNIMNNPQGNTQNCLHNLLFDQS